MKEDKPLPVDQVAVARPLDLALSQVPIGDIVAGMAKNSCAGAERGPQVDPFLIDEQAALESDQAILLEPPRPPLHKPYHFARPLEGEEAEIVGADLQQIAIRRPAGAHIRRQSVRGEDGLCISRQRVQRLVERTMNANVWIEKDAALEIPLEQLEKGIRLDRSAELRDLVAEAKAVEFRQRQIPREDHLETVAGQVDVRLVDQHQIACGVRMVSRDPLHQHPCERDIISRADREKGRLHRGVLAQAAAAREMKSRRPGRQPARVNSAGAASPRR
jgi:predicted HTH domain antitoxin